MEAVFWSFVCVIAAAVFCCGYTVDIPGKFCCEVRSRSSWRHNISETPYPDASSSSCQGISVKVIGVPSEDHNQTVRQLSVQI